MPILLQIILRKLRLYRGGRTLITPGPQHTEHHVCPIGHTTTYFRFRSQGPCVACYCPDCCVEYPV